MAARLVTKKLNLSVVPPPEVVDEVASPPEVDEVASPDDEAVPPPEVDEVVPPDDEVVPPDDVVPPPPEVDEVLVAPSLEASASESELEQPTTCDNSARERGSSKD
ncbi:hypothetical protein WME99_25670 [Sorangium sp. So ce136]|uniref:hypothetical protein n=1 Tax=Sorangium sp. So ce136 TaxID=3133284 RepID=UPI003F1236CE